MGIVSLIFGLERDIYFLALARGDGVNGADNRSICPATAR